MALPEDAKPLLSCSRFPIPSQLHAKEGSAISFQMKTCATRSCCVDIDGTPGLHEAAGTDQVGRSSVRRLRGRVEWVPRMRTWSSLARVCAYERVHLLHMRNFDERVIALHSLWLRSCMSSHPRLVRMPHRFSTEEDDSRPPNTSHLRLTHT